MEFSAFFTDAAGVPALGLSPLPVGTIKATDGTTLSPQTLAETGLGWYTADFTIDNIKNYVGHAYAASQPAGARYAPLATTVQGAVTDTLEDTSATIPAQLDLIQTETDKIPTILTNLALAQVDIDFIKAIEGGKWNLDAGSNQMIFYEDDNVTEVARFNMFAESVPSVLNVTRRERVI